MHPDQRSPLERRDPAALSHAHRIGGMRDWSSANGRMTKAMIRIALEGQQKKAHRANIPADFSFMPIPYLKWIGLSLWAHQS
jgi:hypothetical protein